MDIDELEPRKPVAGPRNLEPLSVAELNAYIAELQDEIVRVKAAIASKQSVRAGADSLFRK